jgi:Domain of unknown function (DUF4189)
MTVITHRRRLAVAIASAAAATVVTVAAAPLAEASDVWGSIAYSGNGSFWGRALDYPTQAAAEAAAVKVCGYSDCSPFSSFFHCGAVALNASRPYGGTGITLSAAMKDALSRAGGGYIDTWGCN